MTAMDEEIVHEFLVESHENLDQLDQDLVALEATPGSRELLSGVFRTIHTIKGTSGFLAFNRLESVTHVGENLLARLRDGLMTMSPETTDALLAMVDKVRELLAQIEADGTEGSVEVDGVVALISAVLEGKQQPEPEPVAEPEPVVAPKRTRAAKTAAASKAKPVAKRAPKRAVKPVADPEPTTEPTPEPTPEATGEPVSAPHPTLVAVPVAETVEDPTPHPVSASEGAPATKAIAESSVRVDVDLLDSLMRLVGELVLSRNQIVQQASGVSEGDQQRAAQRLNLITAELQEGVMKTRMQTVDHVWAKLPRVVRDLSAQCGKQVRLDMRGGDTELDRSLLEAIKDPLTHLVRNAVDHGIETAEDRVAAGKAAVGTLTLRAFHESGQVVIEVTDDGKGISAEAVAAKAEQNGLRTVAQLEQMSAADILQLIFLPGLSTAAAVTNVSGRGVGMDVVKTNIEAVGGTIEMESVPGRGTTCRLRIPLTLAIVPTLTVECDGDRYAIPQVNLRELVSLSQDASETSIQSVNGAPVYRLRGSLLPLVYLSEVLGLVREEVDPEQRTVIAVLQSDGKQFGLVVDRVLLAEEIVVKPLSARLKNIGIYSGATILGDGTVTLILDVQAIARRALTAETLERAAADGQDREAVAETTQVLVAGIGGGSEEAARLVAIPVDMVTRLERIPVSSLEQVGSREVVQYRGAILPVLRLDSHLGVYGNSAPGEDLLVVVYTAGERSVAIVVDEIVDIVETESVADSNRIDDRGLTGSAVIRGRITGLLNMDEAIRAADPGFFDDVAA